jgi:hypothetical protein
MWQKIRELHPFNCTMMAQWACTEWSIHNHWIFAFANNNGVERGDDAENKFVLVKVKWVGNIEGKTKEELELIVPELEIEERVKTEDALGKMDALAGFRKT